MAVTEKTAIRLDAEGVAWLEGTTTKVIEIVRSAHWTGMGPQELHEELPHLSVAQIESALAYYEANREELDADIERRRVWAEQMRPIVERRPVTQAELEARLRQPE